MKRWILALVLGVGLVLSKLDFGHGEHQLVTEVSTETSALTERPNAHLLTERDNTLSKSDAKSDFERTVEALNLEQELIQNVPLEDDEKVL